MIEKLMIVIIIVAVNVMTATIASIKEQVQVIQVWYCAI